LQGELKKKRKEIIEELVKLEALEESGDLNNELYSRKMLLIKENFSLLDQEESYWHKRCHEEWLLKGDNNTKYFHKIANGRKRKNTIISLEKDGNIIEGDENLLNHATEYYANLFGPEEEHNIHIDSSLWAELAQVTDHDNPLLCSPFSESEIKEALFSMERNKVAGPYKIPIEFYQSCWGIVNDDIIQLFNDFYNKKVDISRLNYRIITLLPKVSDA
jgi:mannosylglycoprotein endo-beta-mannosidase